MDPAKNRTGLIIIFIGVIALIAALVAVYFLVLKEPSISNDPDASPPLVDSGDSSGVTTSIDVADGIGGGEDGEEPDFTITLTDGSAQDQDVVPVPLAETTPLTAEALQAILDRLPEWITDSADQVDFRLPGDPIPPPLTGSTIDQPFPLDGEDLTAPDGEYGPLEVLRYAPEGDVPIAPTINITFNQPMVPLATLAQLSEMDVPVEVTPDIPGTWSWIGTRTLRFNFDSTLIDRLPMATVFTVTIPAGTTSVSGETLAQEVSWQFKTPPPTLTQSYPNSGPTDLEPIMFALFDQRIDPQAVLEFMQVTADNQQVKIALAEESDYAEDETISRLVESAPEGRWLVFKAVSPLPPDSYIDIRFDAGTPSAEGPLTTTSSQNFGFNTYPPLKIVDSGCSWYSENEKCYPLSPWYIRFNNPLDSDMFEEGMITIDPILPGAVINISGNSLIIKGASVGNTNYYVSVSGKIGDIFGQTLGRNEKLTFKVGKAEPVLFGPDKTLVTLDPSSTTPILSLYTINYDHLDLQVYRVEPADWPDYLAYVQDYYRTDQPISPPGQLVLDERIAVEGDANTLTEVPIDL
ncbi:MAG: Ig-like domain-containing protein, partial [Anaerolineales bacterium]